MYCVSMPLAALPRCAVHGTAASTACSRAARILCLTMRLVFGVLAPVVQAAQGLACRGDEMKSNTAIDSIWLVCGNILTTPAARS